jgi:hypothetical protein
LKKGHLSAKLLISRTCTIVTVIFFRSLSPLPSYPPHIFFPAGQEDPSPPPSYRTVFRADTENVTPPPDYDRIKRISLGIKM